MPDILESPDDPIALPDIAGVGSDESVKVLDLKPQNLTSKGEVLLIIKRRFEKFFPHINEALKILIDRKNKSANKDVVVRKLKNMKLLKDSLIRFVIQMTPENFNPQKIANLVLNIEKGLKEENFFEGVKKVRYKDKETGGYKYRYPLYLTEARKKMEEGFKVELDNVGYLLGKPYGWDPKKPDPTDENFADKLAITVKDGVAGVLDSDIPSDDESEENPIDDSTASLNSNAIKIPGIRSAGLSATVDVPQSTLSVVTDSTGMAINVTDRLSDSTDQASDSDEFNSSPTMVPEVEPEDRPIVEPLSHERFSFAQRARSVLSGILPSPSKVLKTMVGFSLASAALCLVTPNVRVTNGEAVMSPESQVAEVLDTRKSNVTHIGRVMLDRAPDEAPDLASVAPEPVAVVSEVVQPVSVDELKIEAPATLWGSIKADLQVQNAELSPEELSRLVSLQTNAILHDNHDSLVPKLENSEYFRSTLFYDDVKSSLEKAGGYYFPDDAKTFKDISSHKSMSKMQKDILLEQASAWLLTSDQIVNLDSLNL